MSKYDINSLYPKPDPTANRKAQPVKKLYRLTVITPDGTVTHEVQPKKFELAQLQKAVGGYIETVGFFTKYEGKKCTAYVNEEGLITSPPLPINNFATRLWLEQYTFAHALAGNLAILTRVAPGEGH